MKIYSSIPSSSGEYLNIADITVSMSKLRTPTLKFSRVTTQQYKMLSVATIATSRTKTDLLQPDTSSPLRQFKCGGKKINKKSVNAVWGGGGLSATISRPLATPGTGLTLRYVFVSPIMFCPESVSLEWGLFILQTIVAGLHSSA